MDYEKTTKLMIIMSLFNELITITGFYVAHNPTGIKIRRLNTKLKRNRVKSRPRTWKHRSSPDCSLLSKNNIWGQVLRVKRAAPEFRQAW